MFSTTILLSLAVATVTFASKPCPILGPVFPAPTNLASCSILANAFSALKETLDNATQTGVTPVGPWSAKNNSFSIGVFDTTSTDQLFSYEYSSPVLQQSTQGVTNVTEDSIYRVGSLSKLITAYMFLDVAGPTYWDHAITEYIPELKTAAKNCSAAADATTCTDWNDITLGALASHLAGIPRDYSTPADLLSPLTLGAQKAIALGLPPLPASAVPPCGLVTTDVCELTQYLAGLVSEAPTYAPFTTPVYSNAGYVLLAAALEKISGRSTAEMAADLFQKLNMTQSSYSVPDGLHNAVVPLGVSSGYQVDIGALKPAGGYFSTQIDVTRLGRSILASSLLAPVETREWMKPDTFTSSPTAAVGKPWEIARVPQLVSDHVFDLYTKTGDLFDYSSHLILAPDYNFGFAILVAGNDTTTVRTILAEVVTTALFPALEEVARQQAQENYAGTYKADDGLDSEVVLTTERGMPGLKVENWLSNGTDTFAQLIGADTDLRLYPTDLVQQASGSTQQIAYRAVYQFASTDSTSGIFTPGCETWAVLGSPTYGGVALDDIVFSVENGKATALTARAWRATLKRT